MIKNLLPFVFLIAVCVMGTAQTSQVAYLEIVAKPDESAVDTTQQSVAYVVSVSNYNTADSLSLSLTNAEGTVVYQGGNTLSAWQSGHPYRVEGTTLYLKIGVGTYGNMEHFEGYAYTTSGGVQLPGKSFRKE